MQMALFDAETVASPLCSYQAPCPRKGRATYGPPMDMGEDCINRDITCLTCGARGVESRNLAAKRKGAAA